MKHFSCHLVWKDGKNKVFYIASMNLAARHK